jgi:hypothetical protein
MLATTTTTTTTTCARATHHHRRTAPTVSASVAPVSMSARARIGGGASARFLAPSARARGAALARSRGVTRAMKAPTVRAAATEVRGDAIKIDVRAREVARRARGRAREDGRGWMWIRETLKRRGVGGFCFIRAPRGEDVDARWTVAWCREKLCDS